MTDPLVVTHSDIARFLQCRRAWGWSFVHDYQPAPKLHGPQPLGSRVHSAIEVHYLGGDALAHFDMLARTDAATLTSWGRPDWELDQLYDDIIVGRNCVTAYLDWLAETGADAPFETVAVEHMSEAPLLDGRVILRGKVDQLFRSVADGSLVIHDLKTSANWQGSQREILERSYQHHCYIITEAFANPEAYISAAYYTVVQKIVNLGRLGRTPVERFRVPGTTRQAPIKRAQIEAICYEMLMAMVGAEASDDVLYPSPQQACRWCEYAVPCELVDDNPVAAGEYLAVNFTVGGKHDRYVAEQPASGV